MRIDLVKKRYAIAPATPGDEEALRKVKVGDLLPVVIRKPRNGLHHRKFWAMVEVIAENHHRLRTREAVETELKLLCGHYREHVTRDGEIVFVPRSIRYDEMDQVEFAVFYDKAVRAALTELIDGVDPAELEAYLDKIGGFE